MAEKLTPERAFELLRGGPEGIAEWNRLRRSEDLPPSLEDADLRSADLRSADLRSADLSGADLSGADLSVAKLSVAKLNSADLRSADLSGADLSVAKLNSADLRSADLRGAKLFVADLSVANLGGADLTVADLGGADLRGADLSGAKLNSANLGGADLRGANLSGAYLRGANLSGAKLAQTDFRESLCVHTRFGDVDLSEAKNLDAVHHDGPSTIGVDTLIRSRGNIPESFLRGCGVPEQWITFLPSLLGSLQPIQFYSCFLSHSSADKDFARRLHSRMRDEKLRVWFDEEDIKGGRELHPQIDEAIRLHDKLLLVLSEASMKSKWVKTEIRRARLAEQLEGVRKLFPIRLVPYKAIDAWELPDSSGEDLAEEVRKFFIPDFTNWKDHDAFEAGFARLLRDLKAASEPGAGQGRSSSA